MRHLALIVLLSGCGSSSSSSGSTTATTGGAASEVDPQPCEVDADCLVGTPRGCCASFCDDDRQAWNVARWAEYQADCATEECAVREEPSCPELDLAPAHAVCTAHRCAMSYP